MRWRGVRVRTGLTLLFSVVVPAGWNMIRSHWKLVLRLLVDLFVVLMWGYLGTFAQLPPALRVLCGMAVGAQLIATFIRLNRTRLDRALTALRSTMEQAAARQDVMLTLGAVRNVDGSFEYTAITGPELSTAEKRTALERLIEMAQAERLKLN